MSWRNIDNDEKYKLIEMVKERSILWDSRLDEFKGADTLKMNAWDEVAKEFNICSNKAQRSFRILREHYRKHLANNNEDSWPYFEMMDFLRPIIKLRKKYSYSSSFETKTGKNVESFDDEEIPSSTMIEIPVHAELSDNEHTSRNGAVLKRKISREQSLHNQELHEKFSSVVAAKLNTLQEGEADTKMKKIFNVLFE